MFGAIMAGVGLVSNVLGAKKASKDAKKQFAAAAAQYDPSAINNRMKGLDMGMYNAAYGGMPNWMQQYNQTSGRFDPTAAQGMDKLAGQGQMFQSRGREGALAQLFQAPGYIDPRMMNQAFSANAMGGQQSINSLQGMVGRKGLEGGMADAFAQSALTSVAMNKANIVNDYNTQRTNLMRSDMALSNNMLQGLQGNAMQGAAGAAGVQTSAPQTPNGYQMAGNAISGLLPLIGEGKLNWGKGKGSSPGGGSNMYSTPTSGKYNIDFGVPTGF